MTGPFEADQVTPTWQTYLSWDEDVQPWLQWSSLAAATPATAPPKLQLITDMACQWVQNYLGRPIAPTKFDRKFDGFSFATGSQIALPYYPVLSIDSIVETWGLGGDHSLEYQTADAQGSAGQQMFQVDWTRGVLTRTYQGLIRRPWFPGAGNIRVKWTAGYNPIPADIKIATLEVVAYWWRNTQEAQRTFDRLNEYDSASSNGLWPAIPHRITSLLESYAQVGIG